MPQNPKSQVPKNTITLLRVVSCEMTQKWPRRGEGHGPPAKKSPELSLPTGVKDLKHSGRPLAKLVSGFCTFENPKNRFADRREEFASLKSRRD